jgi:hypothetical protein
MADDVVVINEGLESRTSSTGKQHYTIRVSSEPVVFNLDPKALGRPIAAAIVHHFRERIKGITAIAAPRTLKAREVERRAYQRGEPWAVKRFNGGRTGATPPHDSNRAFDSSGRLANSITGNASSDGAWRINVAANRLDATTGNIERIWTRLRELVPEFAEPARLLENDVLRKAIGQSVEDMRKKAKATTGKLQIGVAKALFDLGRQALDVIDSALG